MIRKNLDDHIETRPDVCSGQPCVSGHRITVRQIVTWHDRMGQSADEIATRCGLSVADVYAALAYYFNNREQIDGAALQSEEVVRKLLGQIPSKVEAKLSDRDLDG